MKFDVFQVLSIVPCPLGTTEKSLVPSPFLLAPSLARLVLPKESVYIHCCILVM